MGASTSATWVLLLGALLLAATSGAAEGSRTLDLQGHRGARGLAPENTLAAFAKALSIGVTTLEMDLGVTRDGVVVVSHDPALSPDVTRGRDGRFLKRRGPPLFALTLDELLGYDVGRLRPGSSYAARFPEQVPKDGQRIPTLKEVIALTRRAGNGDVRFNIETKIDPRHPELTPGPEAFADAVLRVVREEGLAPRTTLQSFDWRTLRHARRVAPAVETVCLTTQRRGQNTVRARRGRLSPFLDGMDVDDFEGSVPRLVKAFGGAAWSPHHEDLTPASLLEAHRLGLRVIVWTVNDSKTMARLIDQGVDGIITDRPDILRRIMAKEGLPLPAPTPVAP